MPIHADVKDFIIRFKQYISNNNALIGNDFSFWCNACKKVNERYNPVLPCYRQSEKLNPYVFMQELFSSLKEGDVTVCGNGAACVIGFQTAIVKEGQRLFTNSGCAAMGYGFVYRC